MIRLTNTKHWETRTFKAWKCVAPGLLLASFVAATAIGETWTDTSGAYTVEAQFVALKNSEVYLKKENGVTIKVPLNRLSTVSQQLALRLAKPREPERLAELITNSIGMKLRLIPPGEFLMGSPKSERRRSDDEYQHRVRITKPFYVGVYEVTQSDWERVMGTGPWNGQSDVREGADYPATYVSWQDAVNFCRRLSAKETRLYRLPTEAEWEYTCRAGTRTAYHFSDDASRLGDYAWYRDNTHDVGEDYAHRVDQKRRNAWGMCDMYGNVWEWCEDWYDGDYYRNSPLDDPASPTSDESCRVLRGGSWLNPGWVCRSARRFSFEPNSRIVYSGFRVALSCSE